MTARIADSVLALREALNLTQGELSRRAGFSKGAGAYISKIERGDNALSDRETHSKLARGFGLTPQELDAYLRGEVSLEDTVARAREDLGPAPEEPAPEVQLEDGDDPFAVALLWALDKERHTMRDLDAVRGSLRGIARMADRDADLIEAARAWLDAAARLRRSGKAVTLESLLLEVTLGSKNAAVSSSAKALQEDVSQEWRERAEARRNKP